MIVLALFLCCMLAACKDTSASSADTAQNEPDASAELESPDTTQEIPTSVQEDTDTQQEDTAIHGLQDLIPDIDSSTGLSVDTGHFSFRFKGSNVYAPASEEEQQLILDYLLSADLSDFSSADITGVSGSGLALRIQTAAGEYDVQFLAASDALYLSVSETMTLEQLLEFDGEQLFLKRPLDAFPLAELSEAVTSVRTNDTDPDNAGVVWAVGAEDAKISVNKTNTACAKDILDGTIETAGLTEEDTTAQYEIALQIGGILYQINAETGEICRDDGEECLYGRVEGDGLELLQTFLGVSQLVS